MYFQCVFGLLSLTNDLAEAHERAKQVASPCGVWSFRLRSPADVLRPPSSVLAPDLRARCRPWVLHAPHQVRPQVLRASTGSPCVQHNRTRPPPYTNVRCDPWKPRLRRPRHGRQGCGRHGASPASRRRSLQRKCSPVPCLGCAASRLSSGHVHAARCTSWAKRVTSSTLSLGNARGRQMRGEGRLRQMEPHPSRRPLLILCFRG